MKKLAFLLILPIFCCHGCQMAEKVEATTEIGLLTNYNFEPETLNGRVTSVSEKYYLVTEENGEFIKGELMNDSVRKALSWAQAFTAEYDSQGVVTRVEYLDDAGVSGYWKIESENGAITKASWISKDTVRSYFLIHPDENGFFASAERYTGGVDTMTNTFEYDCNEMGRWLELRSYLADGSPDGKYTWSYNEEGMLVDRYRYAAGDSLLGSVVFEYDEEGNPAGRRFLKGDMSLEVHETFKFIKYDGMGNWLQRVCWEDGELTGLDERTITYFEE